MKDAMQVLALLKERMEYNSSTGLFVRTKSKGGKPKGSIAGNTDQDGYVVIGLFGNNYKAHRLAWLWRYGCWPQGEIDHIDGVRSNNAISNLRDVSKSDNMKNTRRRKTNRSGITGVSFCSETNKWCARITVDGRLIQLGRFDDIAEASLARKAAEQQFGFHGNHGDQTCSY